MAEALVLRRLDVTLIDRHHQVMPPLDPDMAAHVQAAADGAGVRILLSTDVREIHADEQGRACRVTTSAGELPADHVVLSTGTRPASALAAAAGLSLGVTGAVRVDDRQPARHKMASMRPATAPRAGIACCRTPSTCS